MPGKRLSLRQVPRGANCRLRPFWYTYWRNFTCFGSRNRTLWRQQVSMNLTDRAQIHVKLSFSNIHYTADVWSLLLLARSPHLSVIPLAFIDYVYVWWSVNTWRLRTFSPQRWAWNLLDNLPIRRDACTDGCFYGFCLKTGIITRIERQFCFEHKISHIFHCFRSLYPAEKIQMALFYALITYK